MKTKNTKTIYLEIEQDKVAEFYFSLLCYKMSDKTDTEALKTMADAIHLDKDSVMNTFEEFGLQEQKINDKLLSIHNYLFQSRKKSNDYFLVSKENFENFKKSAFALDLVHFFSPMEISKKWIGRGECAEVKTGIAAYSSVIYYFHNFFAEDLNKGLKKELNTEFSLKDILNQPIKVIANKKGNLCYTIGENGEVEYEVFIEKNGQILKRLVTSNDIEKKIDLEKINSVFLKVESKAIQMKQKENNVEMTYYENVFAKNKKLDLSKCEIVNTVSVPKDQLEDNLTMTEDGNFIFQSEDAKSKNLINSISSLIDNKDNEQIGTQENKGFKIDTAAFAAIYNPLEELISVFLKLPLNKREDTEARNRIILIVYDLLKKHYPDITIHTSATITGYICSNIELLDTEVQHDNSNRKQSYREYLRNSVNNILASTTHIKK